MEAAPYDLCESTDFDVARMERFTDDRSGQWYPVVTCLCRGCGHVFMSPRMTRNELKDFYQQKPRESYEEARGERIGLFKADMDCITEVLGTGEGRNALEVGCYTGYILKRLRDEGWTVKGVEPNVSSAREARSRFGVSVETCSFEEFQCEEGEIYDLVVMGSVLEHINSPTEFLLKVNEVLREGGHLFVRVPNVEELKLDTVADVFSLEHPHMYSPSALRMFYQKTGMRQVHSTTHDQFGRHIISIAQKKEDLQLAQNFEIKNQYDHMSQLISAYNERIDKQRQQVDGQLRALYRPTRHPIALYGAGNHTEFLLRYTGVDSSQIEYLIDSNPKKQGTEYLGFPVVGPGDIDVTSIDAIVVSSRAFQDEIYERIAHLEKEGIEMIRLYDKEEAAYPHG